MLTLVLPNQVYLCRTPTDMRKSFDSLAALVRDELKSDPFSGSRLVFFSRRQDRITASSLSKDTGVHPRP